MPPESASRQVAGFGGIAWLSPLKHRNLNLLGRFTASPPAAGALRPLSDADMPELDEDDEGAD
jgi:hypothetical protein